MQVILRVIYESLRQAAQQLAGNKLRTLLSLLGITIGIFCIIGVQSATNSLQDNVMGSLKKLGDDVIYVQKMSWHEDPGQNYWKYQRRPNPSYDDLKAIQKKVKSAGYADFHVFVGMRTAKFRSNSVEGAWLVAVTFDFDQIFKPGYEKGRWYAPSEYHYAQNRVVIGHKVAESLFGDVDPIGKTIKVGGRDMEVIGVFEKSGKDILKVMDFDDGIIISYELGKKVANLREDDPWGGSINVKAAPGYSVDQLKDELTSALRAERKLKPKEEDNFALNTMSILANLLNQFFSVLNWVGFFIGVFAIVVGMVSVANIMFVSVQERTNIIGIKKAIGAKQSVVLLEFLVESVILCLIGGGLGLLMVVGVLTILTSVLPFEIYMDVGNVLFGVGLSVIVGLLAGFIPALRAARMDPVNAIRHGS